MNTAFAKLCWGGSLLLIDLLVNPTFALFAVVLVSIAMDFVTGIVKAKFKGVNRTSEGYRKTVVKLMQYIVPILILWGAGRYIPEYQLHLHRASGWVMMFIIYIEVTSIFENLYEIDSTSMISKYLYKPMLRILKLGIKNNPVNISQKKAADELQN